MYKDREKKDTRNKEKRITVKIKKEENICLPGLRLKTLRTTHALLSAKTKVTANTNPAD